MVYSDFGGTGAKVSKLGFGAMRLPMKEINGKSVVDEDLAVPLMRRAFDLGVNYVDTAPGYCEKLSEAAVGKALKGYRHKVYLSTKNAIDGDKDGGRWTERLEHSLKQLDTDYIDFYHFWGIGLNGFRSWQGLKFGPVEAGIKAKEQGLIKHLSFSYHDAPENFAEIVDSGCFESVLIQYNLLDRSNEKNLEYAQSKGLGVVVMGPVGGGRLGVPSEVIRGLLENKPVSTAEMALRFVMANENVNVALSGMSEISQVEENAEIASRTGHLTEDERRRVTQMMEENKRLADLYCTGCKYCMPCPQNINIPHLFALMNNHRVYNLTDHAKQEYKTTLEGTGWVKSAAPSACIECGACEGKCPQKLPIIRQLKEVAAELA
ncbi:MAG: aldo/keto reductase [Clostridiales bacterium]|jgi:predicted aldo/keto reductase-like oxidoreductase|nr:aldo/keto reductase [Clostridiales bacterium]